MYIYVSNFGPGMTEQTIRSLFEPFGLVGKVIVSGGNVKFAALEMPHVDEGNLAIQALDGSPHEGQRLIVAECGYEEGRNPFEDD